MTGRRDDGADELLREAREKLYEAQESVVAAMNSIGAFLSRADASKPNAASLSVWLCERHGGRGFASDCGKCLQNVLRPMNEDATPQVPIGASDRTGDFPATTPDGAAPPVQSAEHEGYYTGLLKDRIDWIMDAPLQLPQLTDVMYHAVRGSEYDFTDGGPHTVTGYLNDDCLDEIWDNINTALRCQGNKSLNEKDKLLLAGFAAGQDRMPESAPPVATPEGDRGRQSAGELSREQIERWREQMIRVFHNERAINALCDMALRAAEPAGQSENVLWGPPIPQPNGTYLRVGSSTGATIPEQPPARPDAALADEAQKAWAVKSDSGRIIALYVLEKSAMNHTVGEEGVAVVPITIQEVRP